ncbi:MAG: hypothetical protein ACN6O6_10460 [Pseudomonas sp.]|uniref:hypothetical protein n=1 Tax=Pseudomonas sp. TaxID=306 RepID=UPI003D14F6AA
MNNLPVFSSYTLADHRSGEVWRVTKPTEANPSYVTELNEDGELIQVGNHVHISQEAFAKYQDYTESLQAAGANNSKLAISAGVPIHDPNALGEEESKALLDSLHEDPTTRMYREISERFQTIDKATVELRTASEKLEQTYDSLMARISHHHPNIANKPFGFSVSAEGRIVLQNTDSLNAEQIDYLDKALNGSNALVQQANDVANAHIALTDAEWWNKGIILNRENYANTIDLGADLSYRRASKALTRGTDYIPPTPVNAQDYWRQQLTSKGEKDPVFWSKLIDAQAGSHR